MGFKQKDDQGQSRLPSFLRGFNHQPQAENQNYPEMLKRMLQRTDYAGVLSKLRADPAAFSHLKKLLYDDEVKKDAATVCAHYCIERRDENELRKLLLPDNRNNYRYDHVVRVAASIKLLVISESASERSAIKFAISTVGLALSDENFDVKRNITSTLLNLAVDEEMREQVISVFGNALASNKKDVMLVALEALQKAAENGLTITSVIPVLSKTIVTTANQEIRENATRVLCSAARHKHMLDVAVSGLKEAYLRGREIVKVTVVRALCEMAEQGIDISLAISDLGDALAHKNRDTKLAASEALKFAGAHNLNLERAVQNLVRYAAADNDDEVRNNALAALNYAIKKEQTSKNTLKILVDSLLKSKKCAQEVAFKVLQNAIKNKGNQTIATDALEALGSILANEKNADAKIMAANALLEGARDGVGMAPVFLNLKYALSDSNKNVKTCVVRTLGYAARNGLDIKEAAAELGEVLLERKKDLKLAVLWALGVAIERGFDMWPAFNPRGEERLNKTKKTLFGNKTLGNKDNDVSMAAAKVIIGALSNKWLYLSCINALGETLSKGNMRARELSAWVLLTAVEMGRDISSVIGSLGSALNDGERTVRFNAVMALQTAAKHGLNISSAVNDLAQALNDDDREIVLCAAKALLYAAENKQNVRPAMKNIRKLLYDSNPAISDCVCRTILLVEGKEEEPEILVNEGVNEEEVMPISDGDILPITNGGAPANMKISGNRPQNHREEKPANQMQVVQPVQRPGWKAHAVYLAASKAAQDWFDARPEKEEDKIKILEILKAKGSGLDELMKKQMEKSKKN